MMQAFVMFLTGLASTATVSAAVVEQPFFYEVISPAGQVSHLFGTIHAGVSLDEIPPQILGSIRSARLVLFERLFNQTDSEKFLTDLSSLSMLLAYEENRAELLPENVLKELTELGLPPQIARKLGDGDCYLAGRYRMKWLPHFLDVEIMRFTHQNKIAAGELETPQTISLAQTTSIQKCSLKARAAQPGGLRSWITRFDEKLEFLIRVYRKGEAGIAFTSDEPVMSLRNERWLPRLKAQLERGGTVAVVGVAHLFGYSGLIELLKGHGYRVHRVLLQ